MKNTDNNRHSLEWGAFVLWFYFRVEHDNIDNITQKKCTSLINIYDGCKVQTSNTQTQLAQINESNNKNHVLSIATRCFGAL